MWSWGRSASDLAKVMGSLAEGLTVPKSRLAMAWPPPMPGYQASITPLTLSSHGMETGLPVTRTTTVRGLAFATAAMRASWLSGRASVGASPPSDMYWSAKTMATSA